MNKNIFKNFSVDSVQNITKMLSELNVLNEAYIDELDESIDLLMKVDKIEEG
jgi:hypothetical protein